MPVLGLDLDWSGVGSMATAIIAAIALIVAWKELRAGRDAAAQEIYKEFLTKSLDHAEFIYPNPKLVDPSANRFDGNEVAFWKYEVYVDLMLTAFEELYHLGKPDDQLRAYIGGYLYSHEKYLRSKYFEEHFVQEMDDQFWSFATDAMDREKEKWRVKE